MSKNFFSSKKYVSQFKKASLDGEKNYADLSKEKNQAFLVIWKIWIIKRNDELLWKIIVKNSRDNFIKKPKTQLKHFIEMKIKKVYLIII